jgi:hypothetical protein
MHFITRMYSPSLYITTCHARDGVCDTPDHSNDIYLPSSSLIGLSETQTPWHGCEQPAPQGQPQPKVRLASCGLFPWSRAARVQHHARRLGLRPRATLIVRLCCGLWALGSRLAPCACPVARQHGSNARRRVIALARAQQAHAGAALMSSSKAGAPRRLATSTSCHRNLTGWRRGTCDR